MVSKINLEQEIFNSVNTNQSFILDAGAGSGKTWTLVQTLKYIIEQKSGYFKKNNQKIVCITYTNVAKNEILNRIERNPLVTVNTIHDFLWSCIVKYKVELKEKLIEHLQEKLTIVDVEISELNRFGTKKEEKLKEKQAKLINAIEQNKTNNKPVKYKEYFIYEESIVSHDDIIALSYKIFSSYEMINKIIRDAYPVILIDEYQDTQEAVIKILCEYLHTKENFLLGFFGDKMQKIYDNGIGEFDAGTYGLKVLKKLENYRCSLNVINLLNNIRNDIKQYAAGDNKTVEGNSLFYYSKTTDKNTLLENYLIKNWKVKAEDIKILYLTHRLIAKENNYYELFDLYNSKRKKDFLTDNKNNRGCPFANLLFSIGEIIELYENQKTQVLLNKINIPLNSFDDREKIRKILDELIIVSNTKTIEEIFKFVFDKNLFVKSERLEEFDYEDSNKKEFYEKLIKVEYKQFAQLYKVQQNDTPFSTKHGTKGDEFENILVIIDDKAWYSYNFNNYFEGSDKKSEKRFIRTTNLFYVVCSRAKKNLAVLCISDLTEKAKQTIKEQFGESNYIEL